MIYFIHSHIYIIDAISNYFVMKNSKWFIKCMQRQKWLYLIKVCFVCRWIQHLLHYNAVKAFLFLIVGDTNIKQSFNVIVNNITFPLTHLKSINPRIYPYQRDRYMAYFLEVSSVSGIDWANIRWKNYYYWETIVLLVLTSIDKF